MTSISSNQRIAKNTALLYVRMFITMGIGLYTSRVILQVLGVEDFGIYNVVGGIVIILGFLNQTLAVGTQRYITFALGKENDSLQEDTFASSLFLYLILIMSVFLFAETIGYYILNNYLSIPLERIYAANIVYQFTIITCILSFLQVPFNSAILAYERMDFYAYVSIGEVLLKLVLVLSLDYMKSDKLQAYAFFMALTQFVTFSFYSYYGCKKCKCKFSLKYNKNILESMCVFCGWNIFGALSSVLSAQGVNILLNIYFGPICNAARGISVQVNGAVSQFSRSFQTAANPQITKLYAKENYHDLFKLLTLNSKISFILMCFVTIPFIIELPIILRLWLGKCPEETVLFCRIVLFQSLILTMDNPFVTGIYATGKMKIANLTSGFLYLLVFPISYLTLKYGAPSYSVFLIALFIQPIILIVDICIYNRFTNYPISLFLSNVLLRCLLVLAISLGLTFLITSLLSEGVVRLLLSILFSMLFIIVTTLIIGTNQSERVILKDNLLNIVNRKKDKRCIC